MNTEEMPEMDSLSTHSDPIKMEVSSYRFRPLTGRILTYVFLFMLAILMLLPFLWMLSASVKLDKDVFRYPV